jgi:thiol-disulfide isomerase/thioredoxin
MSKEQDNNFNIILTKTLTCPYCIDFTPIWDSAVKKNNLSKQLGGKKINFRSYNMKDQGDVNSLNQDYMGLTQLIEGYPTVFAYFKHDGKTKVVQVEHTSIPRGNSMLGGTNNNKEIDDAANKFLNNITNAYKTATSDNKAVHVDVQDGGNLNIFSNSAYKGKYLKYKAKYLELKNSKF